MVRIFLSSPGDVAEERALARQLIDSDLPKLPSLRGRLGLELIAWDDTAEQISDAGDGDAAGVDKRGPTPASNLRHSHRRLRLALNAKIG